ncbi:ABC transporter ATP-binding protein [Patescibacteria group bacterium]|nr:ABC transporter ATP-binding protein [Patescibacteria group bacterium]MBU1256222.1 ABC transporter ATP-binding protein [Patescibacteria group bacterium]MBU1457762.1 ABC transporter ATP-binding protein [Patescibacteria group bacterium]
MIKLKNVSKTYFLGEEKVKAVDNVSLEIKKGEYVSIVGPSGCGKSTLMYTIGLLDTPTSGSVYIDGQDVSKLTDEELSHLRNQKIGFVFQSFNLINKFTALENVLLPTKYLKDKLDFDPQERAEELLKQFGIWDRKDFFPNKISGGQQQRVAVARALIMKPSIILADEPTGNLDTKAGHEILDLLSDLNKKLNVTIVLITHEMDIAKRTKRKIVMKDGQVISK